MFRYGLILDWAGSGAYSIHMVPDKFYPNLVHYYATLLRCVLCRVSGDDRQPEYLPQSIHSYSSGRAKQWLSRQTI